MKRLLRHVLLFSLLLGTAGSRADIEASNYTQTRIGEVHSMDYANKTAIISGYRYSFSGVKGYDLPSIRMYRSDAGSYELLRVGMRVNVVYRLSKHARIVVDLKQVADDTKLGVFNAQ